MANIYVGVQANISQLTAMTKSVQAFGQTFNTVAQQMAGMSAASKTAFASLTASATASAAAAVAGQTAQQNASKITTAQLRRQAAAYTQMTRNVGAQAFGRIGTPGMAQVAAQSRYLSALSKSYLNQTKQGATQAMMPAVGKAPAAVMPMGPMDMNTMRQVANGTQATFKQAFSTAQMAQIRWGALKSTLAGVGTQITTVGKNTQWTGRQMMTGLTIPLLMAIKAATTGFLAVNKEMTRIEKVGGSGLFKKFNAEIRQGISEQVRMFGVSQKSVTSLTADLVSMGYSIGGVNSEAELMGKNIQYVAALGDVGLKTATEFYRTTMKVFVASNPAIKSFNDQLMGTNFIIDQLNQIENKTVINLNELASAMPIAAGNAKIFGLNAAVLASALTGIVEKGIPLETAATGLNFILGRTMAPTKKAGEAYDKAFGQGALNRIQATGDGLAKLMKISQDYEELRFRGVAGGKGGTQTNAVETAQVFSSLIQPRQLKTFQPLAESLNEGNIQIRAAVANLTPAMALMNKLGLNVNTSSFKEMSEVLIKYRKEILDSEGMTNGFGRALIASSGFIDITTKSIKQLATEFRAMSAKEIEIKLKSPEAKMRIMSETFKMVGVSLGEAMFPALLKIGQTLLSVFEKFEKMGTKMRIVIGSLLVGISALGPLLYMGGLAASVFGVLFKAATVVVPGLNMVTKAEMMANYHMGIAPKNVGMLGDSYFMLGKSSTTLGERLLSLIGIKRTAIGVDAELITAESLVATTMGVTSEMTEAEAADHIKLSGAKAIATEKASREEIAARSRLAKAQQAQIALLGEEQVANAELTAAKKMSKDAIAAEGPIRKAELAANKAATAADNAETAAIELRGKAQLKQIEIGTLTLSAKTAQDAADASLTSAKKLRATSEIADIAKVSAAQVQAAALAAKIAAKEQVRLATQAVTAARLAERQQLAIVDAQAAASPRGIARSTSLAKYDTLGLAARQAEKDLITAQTNQITANSAAELANTEAKAANTLASESGSAAAKMETQAKRELAAVGKIEGQISRESAALGLIDARVSKAETVATDRLTFSIQAKNIVTQLDLDQKALATAAAGAESAAESKLAGVQQRLFVASSNLTAAQQRHVAAMNANITQTAANMVADEASATAKVESALALQLESNNRRAVNASILAETAALKKGATPQEAATIAIAKHNSILLKLNERALAAAAAQLELNAAMAGAAPAAGAGAAGTAAATVVPIPSTRLLPRTGRLLKQIGGKGLDLAKGGAKAIIPGLAARSAAKAAATAGGTAAATAGGTAAGGAGSAGLGAMLGPAALVLLAIALIAGAIYLLYKNWKEVSKGFSGGLNSLKKSFSAVGDAFGVLAKVFKDAFKSVDTGAESGKKTKSVWEGIGQIFGGVASALAWLIRGFAYIIETLAPGFITIFQLLADTINFVVNIFQFFMALFRGNWSEALGYLGRALADFARFVIRIIDPIIDTFEGLVRSVAKGAGWLAGLLGAKGIKKQMYDFANSLNFTDDLLAGLDKLTKRKPTEVRGVVIQEYRTIRPSEVSEEKKEDSLIPDGSGGGDSAYANFLSSLQAKLGEFISSLKDMIGKEFDAVWKKRLEVFDNQIKAMDDVEKKEAELLATQEYVQSRRDALNKRSLDQENYRRDRGLAIYEGRIDDARNLDLTFAENDRGNVKTISDIDKARGGVLLKATRDLQRQKIADAKKAAEDLKAIEEKALQDQIDLITKYTPKTEAEWVNMMDRINSTLTNYGMPMIAGAWNDGLAMFTLAIAQVKIDISNESFWNGEWAYTGIYEWISKLANIDIKNIVKSMANSAQAGIDESSLGGEGDYDSGGELDSDEDPIDGVVDGDKKPKGVKVKKPLKIGFEGETYLKSSIPRFRTMIDYLYQSGYDPKVWAAYQKKKGFITYLKEQGLFDMFESKVMQQGKNQSSPGSLGITPEGLSGFEPGTKSTATPPQAVRDAAANATLATRVATSSSLGRAVMENEVKKYERLLSGNIQSRKDRNDLKKFRDWQKKNGFSGNKGLREFLAKVVLPKSGAGDIPGTHYTAQGNVVKDEGAVPTRDTLGNLDGKGFEKKFDSAKQERQKGIMSYRDGVPGDDQPDGTDGSAQDWYLNLNGEWTKKKPSVVARMRANRAAQAGPDGPKGPSDEIKKLTPLGDEKKNTDKANKHGKKVGKGFAGGVENGVNNNKDKSKKAVKELAKDMVDAGTKQLDIASPSRVAANQIGKPFVDGIAMGIESASSKLTFKTAVKNLLDSYDRIRRTVTLVIDWNLEGKNRLQSAFESMVNAVLGSGVNINTNIFAAFNRQFQALWVNWKNVGRWIDATNGFERDKNPRDRIGPIEQAINQSPPTAMAMGGMVKRRMGGMLAQIGEGRYDEAVIPLPQGMSEFVKSFNSAKTAPSDYSGMSVNITNNSAPATPQAMSTNIYVDNFIGEPAWFESMMKEYGVKVAPKNQQAYGTINRKVTSYQDNSQRSGRI